MSDDDCLNQEYNGWENRFTWLVHFHLSNEYALNTRPRRWLQVSRTIGLLAVWWKCRSGSLHRQLDEPISCAIAEI